MAVPEVNKKFLDELEAMGFPLPQATRALHYSGNSSVEDAINWVIDHESDPDIDQMPLVLVNIDIEASKPSFVTEKVKLKTQELRGRARRRKEVEEKKSEREREKELIKGGKELMEAKRIAEENERKRSQALREAEKEEEKRVRERIRQKIHQDKAKREGRKQGTEFLVYWRTHAWQRERQEERERDLIPRPAAHGSNTICKIHKRTNCTEIWNFRPKNLFSIFLWSKQIYISLEGSNNHWSTQRMCFMHLFSVERRRRLGLPPDEPAFVKPATQMMQTEKELLPEKAATLPVKLSTKAELMDECLRSLRRNHKDDDAKVKKAFQTLLVYVRNVAKDPNEEKLRKIQFSNPAFQDRVGRFEEGIKFLELCGFERVEGGKYLYLPRDKVEIEVIKSAGTQLHSAITNPFFGLVSRKD